MTGRIDSHQHFWRLDRGDYGWLTPQLAPIYRDYLPADLAPQLARAGVDSTVLVQAAPTVAETLFLLELAREHAFIAGVVGWVDFESPMAAESIGTLAADSKLVGLRPMIQDIPDIAWMLKPGLAPAIEAMIDHDLVFDALVLPKHLPVLLDFAEMYPELRLVVDHGAKPPIAQWRHRRMEARHPARGARHPCRVQDLRPGHRGRQRESRAARSERRSPAGSLRPEPAHVGQRLAGVRTGLLVR